MYNCNSCNRSFSRKWNANRHIQLVHNGYAVAFNIKTGKFSYEKNDNISNQINRSSDAEDQKILNIINKILLPFEDLEKLAAENWGEAKDGYLSDLLISALYSTNPIEVLKNALEYNRSIFGLKKMTQYISTRQKIPAANAEILLKELIRSSRLFKSQR